jgi:hypothetical protein
MLHLRFKAGYIADSHAQFEAKLPARKFRKYKCVQSTVILEEKLGRKSTEEEVWGNEKVCSS